MSNDNEMLDKRGIQLNNKTYNARLYLRIENIIFELESLNNNVIKSMKNPFL